MPLLNTSEMAVSSAPFAQDHIVIVHSHWMLESAQVHSLQWKQHTVNPFKFAGINVRVFGASCIFAGIKVRGPAVEQMSLLVDILGYRHFRGN